ncbi:MAG: CoA pyrophosphatase [Saprospiraceae bacterium]
MQIDTVHLGLRLLDPLPGFQAHARLAPFPSRLKELPAPDHKVASVLLLLMQKNGETVFPLIQRNLGSEKDPHKGQIALPGGRRELTDPNLAFTALRETQEEIGIPAQEITIIGSLSPLYIPVSNNMVHPYVGWTSAESIFKTQPEEIHEVFLCGIDQLLAPDIFQERIINTSYAKDLSVPGLLLGDRWVWGATGMILSELRELLTGQNG